MRLPSKARSCLMIIATAQVVALSLLYKQAGTLDLIAHAGGSVRGLPMTNSLAAMDATLATGVTKIEIDFHHLADGTIVCAHDWDAFGGQPPSRTAWEASFRDDDRPEPCTVRSVGAWLRANPGATIVTDAKTDQRTVLEQLKASDWPTSQTLVQIYDPSEADAVAKMGFSRQIITLYRYRGDLSTVVQLARDGRVEAVTMPERMVAQGHARMFADTDVPVFTHTVNGWLPAGIHALRGVDGIYTDNTQTPFWHPFTHARSP